MINTRDHGYPHVHAIGPAAEAKIRIDTFEILESIGFKAATLKEIVELIKHNQEILLEAWNEIKEVE